MRLFIALDLDDEARAAIAAEQKRIAAALRDRSIAPPKWVRPEHMHLTLVFLGEVAEPRVPPLLEAVREPVAQPPFELTFAGLGTFPPRGRPTVLWVGAGSGSADAIALQQTLRERVQRIGFDIEARPFHPHLTLARWRESRDRDRVLASAAGSSRAVARVLIEHAALYHSRLGSAGPTYTALARATLTA